MELYCKWSCCFCSIRYLLLIGIHVLISNAKLYSDDDVCITNSTTTYSNIPPDCNLFGSEFEEDYQVHKLILNITEIGTYWVGAKIGFQRNINPLGVRNNCNGNKSGSLDECNRHCKGWEYFRYNEYSCSCSKDNNVDDGLVTPQICKNPENGFCFIGKCVVYERDIFKEDYLCGAYSFEKRFNSWLFTIQNCSVKLSFICDGAHGKLQSDANKSSWLEAEHICSQKGGILVQTGKKIQERTKFKDGTEYWVSFFRRKKFSWGEDLTKTVCVAARIQANGSFHLESQFCNKSLKALCHRPDHTNYGLSKTEITTASLGTVLGGALVCIAVVAAIKNRRGHLPNIPTPPQEDFNISCTSTDRIMIKDIDEPLYSNSDDPVGDLSIYSLAMAYSEPGNNKDTPDNQYDSVTYKEPRKTDEDKHYDHIMENHYQNPYS